MRFVVVPRMTAGHIGHCDNPSLAGAEIRVKSSLRGERLLDVLIHEFLHAGLWDLDEEPVEAMGRDLARALWRMGFRLCDEC